MRKRNFRKTLSFLLYVSEFFAVAKSYISPKGSDIVRLCLTMIFYSPLKLAQRISLVLRRISLRSNITRRRRIELARYS